MPYVDLDEFGHYEVFYVDDNLHPDNEDARPEDHTFEEGWYWWNCQPGFLPEGEPQGPHDSEDEARNDLNEEYLEYLAQMEDEQ